MSALPDYSQAAEQAIITRFFQELTGDYAAFFVDVGAYDGLTGSNSRLLAELGWSGILIEPTTAAFAKLAALYLENPRVACVRCAVSDFAAESVEMLVAKGPPGTPDSKAWEYGQVSTLNRWFAKECEQNLGYRYEAERVEVRPLTPILRERHCPQNLGLLCIDCEGEDVRILRAFDFNDFQPRLLGVECDVHNRSTFGDFLADHGYIEYDHTPSNTFFRRRA